MKKFVAIKIVIIITLTLCSCNKNIDINSCESDVKNYQSSSFDSDLKEDYQQVDIKVLYQKFLDKEITALDDDGAPKVLNDFLLYSSEPLEYTYTYFDMTGDGIKELCVKQYSSISFFTVKNAEIHHWYTTGSYTSLLNNGALLYERHGGAPTHINYEYYVLDKNADITFNVTFSWWDGKTVEHGKIYPDSYLFNDKEISKEKYEEKTKEYLTIGDDEIIWN